MNHRKPLDSRLRFRCIPLRSRADQRRVLRRGRVLAAVVVFLLLFAIVLVGVSQYYLLPAIDALKSATPAQQARLVAMSRLVLMVVLFALFASLALIFHIGRFFLPRPGNQPTKTKYIDAWKEAGERMKKSKESNDE